MRQIWSQVDGAAIFRTAYGIAFIQKGDLFDWVGETAGLGIAGPPAAKQTWGGHLPPALGRVGAPVAGGTSHRTGLVGRTSGSSSRYSERQC